MLGGGAETIPRSQWRVAGHTITLDGGFEPGKTYEVSYRAANPPVAGLGYVAVRDTTAWLKHQPDALAPVRFAYGYGSSQSGRFLRGFLYEGFNTDEHDRQVFDGVMAHIAGASRLSLNERWAKPTGLGAYNATAFPFADASLRDPISGAQRRPARQRRGWAATRRRCSTPTRRSSTGAPAASRHWFTPRRTARPTCRCPTTFASTSSPARSIRRAASRRRSPTASRLDNPIDYWWTMRALLLAMHKWVKEGAAPPPSLYPRLQDHTLVPAASVAFPAIPGVASPRALDGGRPHRESVCSTAARAPARRCRCWCRRSTKTATSARASGCPRSPCRWRPTPAGTSASRRSARPSELVSLLGSSIFFPRDARRARGGEGSAPLDRGALPIAGRVSGESGAGGRRAREGRLPARGRRAADPAARLGSVGRSRR